MPLIQPTAVVQTSLAGSPTNDPNTLLLCDASVDPIDLYLPLISSYLGKTITYVKMDPGPNTVTIHAHPEDETALRKINISTTYVLEAGGDAVRLTPATDKWVTIASASASDASGVAALLAAHVLDESTHGADQIADAADVAAVATDLATETADRESADTTLTTAIAAEATARDAAIATAVDNSAVSLAAAMGTGAGSKMARSPLSSGGVAAVVMTTDVAYWVYVGKLPTGKTIDYVSIYTAATNVALGAQTAEVAVATGTKAPDGTADTLTVEGVADDLEDLTVASARRNNLTPIGAAMASGAHVWIGIRVAMATTQPIPTALVSDMGAGVVGTTAAAGVLAAGPYTMTPWDENTLLNGPDLRATFS